MGERAVPKVVFMGTPTFAAQALKALIGADNVDVVAVLQPTSTAS